MHASSSLIHQYGPGLLRGLAIMAFAVGLGVWSAILLAPQAPKSSPLLDTPAAPLPDTRAVAHWFGGAQLRVTVTAHGVIAAADGSGAALLSVDGAAPRAYRVGQTLAPGVVLDAVSTVAVSIAQDGSVETVAIPPASGHDVRGFLPGKTAQH